MKLSYIGFAALLLLASGCRDTSSPSKALLGHWVTTSDGIEIHRCYSSDGSAIYFNKTQDNLERLSYKVVAERPSANTIQVQMVGYNTVEIIEIDKSNRSALVSTDFDAVKQEHWKYVNGNTNCR